MPSESPTGLRVGVAALTLCVLTVLGPAGLLNMDITAYMSTPTSQHMLASYSTENIPVINM